MIKIYVDGLPIKYVMPGLIKFKLHGDWHISDIRGFTTNNIIAHLRWLGCNVVYVS